MGARHLVPLGTGSSPEGTLAMVEAAQGKLAVAVVNAELIMAMLPDGLPRERARAALAAIWAASSLLSEVQSG
jgi:hypothetical protein